jgi:hypothetical protein
VPASSWEQRAYDIQKWCVEALIDIKEKQALLAVQLERAKEQICSTCEPHKEQKMRNTKGVQIDRDVVAQHIMKNLVARKMKEVPWWPLLTDELEGCLKDVLVQAFQIFVFAHTSTNPIVANFLCFQLCILSTCCRDLRL